MSNTDHNNEWEVGGLYQYNGVGIYSSLFENGNNFIAALDPQRPARDQNDLYICIEIVQVMPTSYTKVILINMRTYQIYETRAELGELSTGDMRCHTIH